MSRGCILRSYGRPAKALPPLLTQGLKKLAKLGLYNNKITGTLEPLQGCVALQKIYLCENLQLMGHESEVPFADLIC